MPGPWTLYEMETGLNSRICRNVRKRAQTWRKGRRSWGTEERKSRSRATRRRDRLFRRLIALMLLAKKPVADAKEETADPGAKPVVDRIMIHMRVGQES